MKWLEKFYRGISPLAIITTSILIMIWASWIRFGLEWDSSVANEWSEFVGVFVFQFLPLIVACLLVFVASKKSTKESGSRTALIISITALVVYTLVAGIGSAERLSKSIAYVAEQRRNQELYRPIKEENDRTQADYDFASDILRSLQSGDLAKVKGSIDPIYRQKKGEAYFDTLLSGSWTSLVKEPKLTLRFTSSSRSTLGTTGDIYIIAGFPTTVGSGQLIEVTEFLNVVMTRRGNERYLVDVVAVGEQSARDYYQDPSILQQ